MTVKLSISVPDDVAEWLGAQPNASSSIAQVIRGHMHATRTDIVLRMAGFEVTDEGKARWRDRLRQQIPASALAKAREITGE